MLIIPYYILANSTILHVLRYQGETIKPLAKTQNLQNSDKKSSKEFQKKPVLIDGQLLF